MDCKNHLEKNPIQKIEKTVKNQSEIAACEQKTTSEKANFCSNTVFSPYFKFRAKNFTPQNHSLFRSISCFGVTKITTPIWLQKSWKCVNRSFKKNIAGRIPETTRSENPFKNHPTTHQTKRASTNLWLSWNKIMKQKSKNNKICWNMIKNLIKFCYKLRSRIKYLCQNNFIKTTSTYKNHLCEFWKNTLG